MTTSISKKLLARELLAGNIWSGKQLIAEIEEQDTEVFTEKQLFEFAEFAKDRRKQWKAIHIALDLRARRQQAARALGVPLAQVGTDNFSEPEL